MSTRCKSRPPCAGVANAAITTKLFGTDPPGLEPLTTWLGGLKVEAATMEGTGVYWIAPYRALEDARIRAELVHAQHVKQIKGRKTDLNVSIWLARTYPKPVGIK